MDIDTSVENSEGKCGCCMHVVFPLTIKSYKHAITSIVKLGKISEHEAGITTFKHKTTRQNKQQQLKNKQLQKQPTI